MEGDKVRLCIEHFEILQRRTEIVIMVEPSTASGMLVTSEFMFSYFKALFKIHLLKEQMVYFKLDNYDFINLNVL